jgi:hypothetical protein
MGAVLKRMAFVMISFTMLSAAEFLEQERLEAIKEHKMILLTIESEACPFCQKMKHEIFEVKTYKEQIDKHFIFVSKNANDPSLPAVFRTPMLPANALLMPQTQEIVEAYTGYIEPKMFMSLLDKVYQEQMK